MPEQQETPPPQDLAEVTEVIPEPKPKSKKKVIIAVVAVVIVLLVGSLVLMYSGRKEDSPTTDTVEEPRETVLSTVYTSDKGFTFTYPGGAFLREYENSIEIWAKEDKGCPDNSDGPCETQSMAILSEPLPVNTTLDEFVKADRESGAYRFTGSRKININGNDFVEYEYEGLALGPTNYHLYTVNDSKVYTFLLGGEVSRYAPDNFFHEILSTFRFVDLTTYSSPELGIEFKYPSDFVVTENEGFDLFACSSDEQCLSYSAKSLEEMRGSIDELEDGFIKGESGVGKSLIYETGEIDSAGEAYTNQVMSAEGIYFAEAYLLADDVVHIFSLSQPTAGLEDETLVYKNVEWLRDLVLSTVKLD